MYRFVEFIVYILTGENISITLQLHKSTDNMNTTALLSKPWNIFIQTKGPKFFFGLTLVLLCPDIYGVEDVLDQWKYHLILIK